MIFTRMFALFARLVFETIVRDQVVEFLEVNKLIRDSQHGFRKGSSCLIYTVLFLDKILHSIDEGHDVEVGVYGSGLSI